jgi:hypothetical protein
MISWFDQLEEATTVAGAVAVARDYIAMWSPQEIALLPPAVRPGRLRDEADIAELHERLVDEYRTTRASGEQLSALQRLMGFFARASVRIAQLAPSALGTEGNDESAQPGTRAAGER